MATKARIRADQHHHRIGAAEPEHVWTLLAQPDGQHRDPDEGPAEPDDHPRQPERAVHPPDPPDP